MQNLDQRFEQLKRRISGNKEYNFYQMVQGPDENTRQLRTGLSRSNNRILSQIHFSLRLTERLDGKYDDLLSSVFDYLEARLDEDGVLTNKVCAETESMMLEMSQDAKEYTIILAAHSHIDVNWLWDWPETVATTLDTFRTMLHLMEEYPQFCFSQSQGLLYKIVEDYDPEMKKEIEMRIREGRWEVTASAWVENDKNMPSTESQLRHIEYTHNYMESVWGVPRDSLNIDFSPDTFGHSACLPEIYRTGNVSYAYYCRGCKDPSEYENFIALHRWRAPSGAEVLAYREPYWYSASIYPVIAAGVFELERKCCGLKTSLYIYGVGDHGGGPSRRDIETGMEMQTWPVFPTVRFGTIGEFFQAAETVREKVPLLEGELNFKATGCYTTTGRIKMANRRTENALIDAEAWANICDTVLKRDTPTRIEKSWYDVLAMHFHDILPGCNVESSAEYAMGRFAEAQAAARIAHANATRLLSEAIDTSSIETDEYGPHPDGVAAGYAAGDNLPTCREASGMRCYAGVPNIDSGYGKTRIQIIFNPLPYERECVETLTIWDWIGLRQRLCVTDVQGNDIPFAIMETDTRIFWDHHATRVLVKVRVPAMGYTTVVIRERELDKYPTYFGTWGENFRGTGTTLSAIMRDKKRYILENENICATFDPYTGCLCSLVNKATGEEVVDVNRMAGLELSKAQYSADNAWELGNICERISVRNMVSRSSFKTSLREGCVFEYRVYNSIVKLTVTLDSGASMLKYHFHTVWEEAGTPDTVSALSFMLPLCRKPDHYRMDIPGGHLDRGPLTHDVPASSYAAAVYGNSAISVINDARYGYFCEDSSISLRLIHTSRYPNLLSEVSEQDVCFYIALCSSDPATLARTADVCNHPVNYVSASRHPGILPATGSFLQISGDNAVYTSLRKDDSGQLEMRYFSTSEDALPVSVQSQMMEICENSCCAAPLSIGKILIRKAND